MRLKRIKLAGFKSFVDPTVVEFPSALVGVAGPNGSGKSNIIDAVRWVMGESSAKHLRGGQIADVIFNGSSGRQPVGTATVEMVFDNTEGRLGGEYASWNEIAIRRSVDREGVSGYFLNGTRCRRKDITDVFLGTGLGPRSYAIIEQGTISRLVESRPQELREFLEEAAGISRYKERRRETESRMSHTRENLERVDDLLEEVGKHLSHLRRQARAAERYKELKAEERRLRAELLALRMQALEDELTGREDEARRQSVAVEAEAARERSTERELAAARTEHDDTIDAANRVQQRYFELQTEIARLEEAITGAQRERELREERVQALGRQLEENARRADEDAQRAAALRSEVERHEPELEAAEARAGRARQALEAADAEAAARQQTDAEHREILADARRQLAIAETQASAASQRERTLRDRAERLTAERERLEEQALGAAGEAARGEVTRLRGEAHAAEAAAERAEGYVQDRRRDVRVSTEALAEVRRELATVEARLESLAALARAEQGGETTDAWLSAHGLDKARRLAAGLEIEPGWEWAIEVALGRRLDALEVEGVDTARFSALDTLGAGDVTVVENGTWEPPSPESLAAKLRRAVPAVVDFLAGVRTAASAAEAWNLRESLGVGESVITPDGTWVGKQWIRAVRPVEETTGVIEREREREQLAARKAELDEELAKAQAARHTAEEALRAAESAYAEARGVARGAQEALSGGLAAEAETAGRERGAVERLEAIGGEVAEIEEALAVLGAERETLAEAVERARRGVETLESERAEHEVRLQTARAAAQDARREADAAHAAREALALRLGSARAQAAAAEEAANRLRAEREALAAERERLEGQLSEVGDPAAALREQLNACLGTHRRVDQELLQARDQAAAVESRVAELEHQRHAIAQRVAELREGLSEARLSAQELKTRREGLAEQLAELGSDMQRALAELESGANAPEWEQRLEQVSQRIQRLGAINLAAIDECAAEAEREDYLKRQRADLSEALETLESAIRKIDRETRNRFKETFERVNGRLRELFPRLFGGGQAALVLTGEELLDAGVVVTAQPPGKKNATIQMLSGGEKALVAVALVFAIFELNPAPFCLLDEVDAPMDDANVERFCALVREMSERTQFVLITHNRRTMALCHQLVGVTMQEPGVSRLVGVDIDEAERLAVG